MLSTMFTRLVRNSTDTAFGGRTPAGLTQSSLRVYPLRYDRAWATRIAKYGPTGSGKSVGKRK